ncbi:hypothetical protein TBR22_A09980 [Luteitalea sp. TBR-22]|nr:hypothetical protein TBR22_A09980 [Luteitalea sp. TBR-22]
MRYRWSSAVQTTCESCRSVIVRHDVDIETIGEIADLPPDASPIQLGTQGSLDGQAFTVVGRIVYEYEQGRWNEWHLVYDNGTSGWLSDAQLEFAVSSVVTPDQPLPPLDRVTVGVDYTWNGRPLKVTTMTVAHYKGVEGELPFEYWGKDDVSFVDLRGHDATFGTIDYSDDAPLLFIGRLVAFEELNLRNLRTFDASDASKGLAGFNCANCGAAVELRALSHTLSVACTSCGAVIDARDRNVVALQDAAAREWIRPVIPLGSRGQWAGQPYDVIGFQQRSVTVDGTRYPWDEYVLFNPYHGFRYLTAYNGHWNDVTPVRELPAQAMTSRGIGQSQGGNTFKHFQRATARTDYVLGEFPWRAQAGESVETDDYVDPPFMLSAEGTAQERTWSRGVYTDPKQIWQAFQVPGDPPVPEGVFANQPNPYVEKSRALWRAFRWLAGLLLVLMLWRLISGGSEQVFSGGYTYVPGQPESSFVTPTFTLKSAGTVDVKILTSITNSWIGFDVALVNLDTGEAQNVDAEIGYYAGVEGGESWTEGSRSALMTLPRMPAGQYYLRVEPEGPAGVTVPYTISVRRDVPDPTPYLLGIVLLLIRPLWIWFRKNIFEHKRDQESDYASSGSDDDDDDDE